MEKAIASERAVCAIHRDFFFEIFRGLLECEFAEGESHVHFHAERAQTHEIVNDLASVRAVVEQTSLQHHFFGVKADAFVRAGVVVMTADRVFVFPGKTKLKIMAGNSFVHGERPRILRRRAPEVTEIPVKVGRRSECSFPSSARAK